MKDFTSGQKIKLTNGKSITVISKIGEGGQGAVYKVDCDGKEYALKWYFQNYLSGLKPNCKEFYNNLCGNVKRGSPSDAFLWPIAIAVTGQKSNGFGYVMELRPKGYDEFTTFIKAKNKFKSTEVVIQTAINILDAFQKLHAKGLSYQDLSPGNFFINKENGDVLICDNDNVAPDGINLGVGGTPGYIAPEVILGKSKPDANTDLFSLSVILFELFFLSHPLDGANCCKYPCLTQTVERYLYAEKPCFVMGETQENPPVRGIHSNVIKLWPAFPDYLHEGFRKVFEDGINDSKERLTDRAWKEIVIRLMDEAVQCPKCGEVNFPTIFQGTNIKCTECGKVYTKARSLAVNQFSIGATSGKTLTEYHTKRGDHKTVIGTVVESKKNPGVMGLRNDSCLSWTVSYPEKETMIYEPGKVVTLIKNTQIEIDNTVIEVK